MFNWITGKGRKDKKKDTRKQHDERTATAFKVTTDNSSDRLKIDTRNMASDDQDRGVNAFVSKCDAKRLFEKDQLAEVKQQLTAKNLMLCELIGSGAYSDVYRGRNNSTDRDVAIKIIALTEENRHYQENFLQQEIEVVQKLNHPRIIKLYSIFQADNKIVMVMEYADRGTMGDLISKRGALRESATLALFREILRGLAYMHRKSIAHRDLKLENILITKHWVPKLADFSFSVYFDGHTLLTDWCGSLPYFAPELLRHEPYNPLASDIWSLGVCLFVISNDTFPFKTGNDEAMKQAQMEGRWTLRGRTEKNYSPQYKNLLRLMLEPKTRYRPTAAQISEHPWVATEVTRKE